MWQLSLFSQTLYNFVVSWKIGNQKASVISCAYQKRLFIQSEAESRKFWQAFWKTQRLDEHEAGKPEILSWVPSFGENVEQPWNLWLDLISLNLVQKPCSKLSVSRDFAYHAALKRRSWRWVNTIHRHSLKLLTLSSRPYIWQCSCEVTIPLAMLFGNKIIDH